MLGLSRWRDRVTFPHAKRDPWRYPRRVRHRLFALRFAVLAGALLGVSACSTVRPSVAPQPTPAVTCDTSTWTATAEKLLSCDEAVNAATLALPASHAVVLDIRFQWGAYCPPGQFCPGGRPSVGTVFFTFTDGPRSYVEVIKDQTGVRVASSLIPIPSPLPSAR